VLEGESLFDFERRVFDSWSTTTNLLVAMMLAVIFHSLVGTRTLFES